MGRRLVARLFVVGVAVGCAGQSIEGEPEGLPDVSATAGGTGGVSLASGGNAVGSGAQGGSGGTSSGGAGGKGGAAVTGGSSGRGGRGGSGGSGGEPRSCTFRALPESVRCEESAAYAQDPELEKLDGVTSLGACEAACEERGDCTHVVFYPPFEAPGLCRMMTKPCDSPGTTVWAEESASKDFRKVCDGGDIAAGYTHACGLDAQGEASCWDARTGVDLPAPSGTFQAVVAGDHQSCALRTDGSATCWLVEEWEAAVEIPGDVAGPFVDLSMGGDFACGILAEGGIKCWGSRVR